MAAANHCGWWWPFAGAVIITERPSEMHRDVSHRLHCETGPALRYPDGWSIHAWHGVRVPGEWIEQRDSVDPGLALTHSNIEQRTALANILGWGRVLAQLSPRVVDADEPHIGELLEVDLPDAPGSRFLRVVGPGNDGPDGIYVLGVPREMQTASAAHGWTYGFDHYQQGERT